MKSGAELTYDVRRTRQNAFNVSPFTWHPYIVGRYKYKYSNNGV